MIPVGTLCVVVPPAAKFVGEFVTVVDHTEPSVTGRWADGVIAPFPGAMNIIDIRNEFGFAYCAADESLRIIRPPRSAQPAPPVTRDEPVAA